MEIFSLFLLSLLITAHGIAENTKSRQHDKVAKARELERFDYYEEDGLKAFENQSWTSGHSGKFVVNVDIFGAIGDGSSDDTQAFSSAWSQACSTPKSVFLVPKGKSYLVNATRFNGPCAGRLKVQIDGKIVAPAEPKDWDPNFARLWLVFSNLTEVIFRGRGVIDGSGSKWWAASCKKNKTNPCIGAPAALQIETSSAIRVRGLTIQNSQQKHFVISQSDSVRLSNVIISSPADSPNTDGIHMRNSTNVALLNSKIRTGDDCISIIGGCNNIRMKKIFCGPGHGISIGSLGKDNSTDIVENVVLSGAYITNTTNGLRIKSWQGGSGYVKAVRFKNVFMDNVQNPIIIDQFYCDSTSPCVNQTSAVQVRDILYLNVFGTTNSTEAMRFACSDTVPCKDIVLSNVDLRNKNGTTETYCNSATGFGLGLINPSADCLTCHDKDYSPDGTMNTKIEKS